MTVSFNPYLRKFLALYQNFASQRLAYRVSSSPQGPWSDEGAVPFSQPPAASFGNYAGHGHDEFSQGGGRIVFLTYAHPTGGLGGEIRIVKVEFG